MGDNVGFNVGLKLIVGIADGSSLAFSVGESVGLFVGCKLCDGTADGRFVGHAEGISSPPCCPVGVPKGGKLRATTIVGTLDGEALEDSVGKEVGLNVGFKLIVGIVDGSSLAVSVGNTVGLVVGSKL